MTKVIPGSQSLVFDRGIESITFARDLGDLSLPERAQSAPPEMSVRPQLDMLLERPSLDDGISNVIRPPLVDRDLLVPGKFREALDGALQRLKDAAARHADSAGAADGKAGADGGDDSLRVLNRATRLLSEEVNLRDLVQMYRSALYQG